MTLIIGLTGGIASGKSTVSNMFKEKNITVVDADQIARDVVEIGKTAYKEIVQHFGKEILNNDETINRAKLGSIIFQSEEERKILNNIVHPEVRKEMMSQTEIAKENKEEIVVLDIPLLYESNLTHLVHKTLLVYVDENVQVKRLMERNNYTYEEAKMRMEAQLSLEDKLKLVDHVINNNGTIGETEEQLNKLINEWLDK
ncbi:dephospho-CoA kinase [Metabacillus fastidiosus]|uniref:Dephospho-CoA kinase n=1 Tax=Metabacillus fastidiosus TaxID=1458 RepID=A0ABU6NW88_9BACI|nr:dephospho-CoA kinase [Metabacillus fastidiosus]MED4401170.1 dephospho-CoA kinase [Metabacillus fastidiosus]